MSDPVASIKALLDSESFSDKVRGLNQLRALEPAQAFPLLKPLVNDANPRIRYAAVSQLDPVGNADLEQSLQLLRDRLFNDPEIDVQSVAADVIGGLKLTAAYPDLKKAYEETPEWLLQMSIVATLGEMGDSRGFDLLKIALSSENSLIRTAAISALGELGNPDAFPLLVPLAQDEDWQVRYRLALAVGHLEHPDRQSLLQQLAQDKAEQVASTARELLAA
ncbi:MULTISPECIES: phycobilisome degradation protein NblB [Synechocystis]|uniref:HEAT repeat domain-containing protein n=1 Tax=Synechocystis salina LEGE 00031 TaxID=1828736 RepID=A0ABR9VTX1_9SYNC|nr:MULTISPECIES: HEAT repeat domain-containing protein [Synechocystis]MBE9195378.1 HEAT repeat domain-containing protein [Synechocystis sp. LEGE 06083]MBE9240737.1 HEAT repeat domain-containing protein [Synechocystis salina LEGE 00041]MBE9254343.1 HEAT repeat domain-containing protein [Synechocystis salina LEGE 00031]